MQNVLLSLEAIDFFKLYIETDSSISLLVVFHGMKEGVASSLSSVSFLLQSIECVGKHEQ